MSYSNYPIARNEAQLSNRGYRPVPSDEAPTANLLTLPPSQSHGSSRLYTKPKQPYRTTKTSVKLTLFPETTRTEEDVLTDYDEVYNQVDDTSTLAKQETKKLSKLNRSVLPRVTAYCTAESYKMEGADGLFRHLQSRKAEKATPIKIDECIYTPLVLPKLSPLTASHSFNNTSPSAISDKGHIYEETDSLDPVLMDALERFEVLKREQKLAFSGEVFFFDYGVVVMWGFSQAEEADILNYLLPFEMNKIDVDDVEIEEFNFLYIDKYQPRIYNDIITLKNPSNYMIKLTISHAIAQSVKMAVFENKVDVTINATKNLPELMAKTGKVQLSRTAITKKIGQLFMLIINVNLVSNVLDAPEIFWSEPALEPLYSAIRGYLEISQRVELLNQRCRVLSDLLDMLKEHLNSSHGEQLEWIVIILIGFEIVVGIITICFDYVSFKSRSS